MTPVVPACFPSLSLESPTTNSGRTSVPRLPFPSLLFPVLFFSGNDQLLNCLLLSSDHARLPHAQRRERPFVEVGLPQVGGEGPQDRPIRSGRDPGGPRQGSRGVVVRRARAAPATPAGAGAAGAAAGARHKRLSRKRGRHLHTGR